MIKLKDLIIKESYIGSCVDIGNQKNVPILNYFNDANDLSHVVNPDGDNFIKISYNRFFKYFPMNTIPKKILKGELEYYRIKKDGNGNEMTDEDCGLWWIYNVTQDIHYFFDR